jgi:hypothetical protein
MKIRTSFVSNSSSSSFIITQNNKDEALKHDLTLHSITTLLDKLEEVKQLQIELTEKISNLNLPEMIEDECYDLYNLTSMITEIEKINEEYPDSYITDEIDNDYIYGEQIFLPTFRNNL